MEVSWTPVHVSEHSFEYQKDVPTMGIPHSVGNINLVLLLMGLIIIKLTKTTEQHKRNTVHVCKQDNKNSLLALSKG